MTTTLHSPIALRDHGISAVGRCMAILDAFSRHSAGLTSADLVTRLGIEKSAVSRILASLEADGYVVRDPKTPDLFRIAYKFAAVSLRFLDTTGLHDLCGPLLRPLAEKSGELVQLAIQEAEQLTYVAKAEGPQRIQFRSLLGTSAPLHASTAGKVWLASFTDEQAMQIVLAAGMPKLARNTITSIDGFRTELRRVRDHGYATVEEELLDGGSAIGVPIRNKQDTKVVGAVVITGPSFRFPKKRMIQFVDDMLAVAGALAEIREINAVSNNSQSATATSSSPGPRSPKVRAKRSGAA